MPLDAGANIDATTIVSSSLTWQPVNVDGADLRRGDLGGS
jgi:acetamidase/formamidase